MNAEYNLCLLYLEIPMTSIDVLHMGEPGLGWGPIDRLAHLAADMFDGNVLDGTPCAGRYLSKFLSLVENPTIGKKRGLLVIARSPSGLRSDALSLGLIRHYGFAVAWVIDGFRHADIEPKWRTASFDFIGVTRPNDVEVYEQRAGIPVLLLPWGSDVLALGSGQAERPVDLLRVGRQPDEWENDRHSAQLCARHGITFAGRPSALSTPFESHVHLMAQMARSRFVMAHCNLAAPAPYTHPTQAYITARWTDALAAGCVVAGMPPYQDQSIQALWPEALLEFDKINAEINTAQVAEACREWTADIAAHNHREALIRLDWRWRLQTIAHHLALRSPALEAAIAKISIRVAASGPLGSGPIN